MVIQKLRWNSYIRFSLLLKGNLTDSQDKLTATGWYFDMYLGEYQSKSHFVLNVYFVSMTYIYHHSVIRSYEMRVCYFVSLFLTCPILLLSLPRVFPVANSTLSTFFSEVNCHGGNLLERLHNLLPSIPQAYHALFPSGIVPLLAFSWTRRPGYFRLLP
jgi:hypothetical protein